MTQNRRPVRPFTQRELAAMEEALNFRLAGPIDFDKDEENSLTEQDYETAHTKVMERLK